MANDFTGNPWIVDTAAATDLTVTAFGQSTRIKLKSIRWSAEVAAAGNNAVVQDAAGRKIWEGTATGANYSESEMVEHWVSGLVVPTLDAGTLFLTLE